MTKLWLTKSVLYFPFEITDFIKLDQVKIDFVSQNNIFMEPYEELWKKILGTAIYFLEILAGFVILALIKYERGGHVGHFRTAFNQLISWKYSLVSNLTLACIVGFFFLFFYQTCKGQIISECPYDILKSSKKPTKNLTNFCPETKKWSNQQSKDTYL